MTYEQIVASRPARIAAAQVQRAECCAGCRQSFASYGMTKAQAYVEDGQAFCNSDCAMSAEVASAEADSFARLADEF